MEEKKEKVEEIQSRRDFFKSAAKKALPILGAIALANIPLNAKGVSLQGSTGCQNGCNNTCSNCSARCSGCGNSCFKNCDAYCHETCYTKCQGDCKGSCYRNLR